MYPVNGLRRDVLGLCHQVERAIGWVRTSSRLAAMRRTPTAVELAERLLAAAATERRMDRLGARRFTGYSTMPAAALPPCVDAAKGLTLVAATQDLALAQPNDRLARHIAGLGPAP